MSDQKTEISIVNETALANVFSAKTGDELDALLNQIEEMATSEVPDLEKPKGRQRIASLAAKVASSKTTIDGFGKELVSGWKEKAKAVDQRRKMARDRLDELKVRVRAPLTEWERK